MLPYLDDASLRAVQLTDKDWNELVEEFEPIIAHGEDVGGTLAVFHHRVKCLEAIQHPTENDQLRFLQAATFCSQAALEAKDNAQSSLTGVGRILNPVQEELTILTRKSRIALSEAEAELEALPNTVWDEVLSHSHLSNECTDVGRVLQLLFGPRQRARKSKDPDDWHILHWEVRHAAHERRVTLALVKAVDPDELRRDPKKYVELCNHFHDDHHIDLEALKGFNMFVHNIMQWTYRLLKHVQDLLHHPNLCNRIDALMSQSRSYTKLGLLLDGMLQECVSHGCRWFENLETHERQLIMEEMALLDTAIASVHDALQFRAHGPVGAELRETTIRGSLVHEALDELKVIHRVERDARQEVRKVVMELRRRERLRRGSYGILQWQTVQPKSQTMQLPSPLPSPTAGRRSGTVSPAPSSTASNHSF